MKGVSPTLLPVASRRSQPDLPLPAIRAPSPIGARYIDVLHVVTATTNEERVGKAEGAVQWWPGGE
jgi:hypothetical protein